jgi:flotillin
LGFGLEVPLLSALAVAGVVGLYRLLAPNCPPYQIMVIAGRGQRRSDGQSVGYRVVHGGRALVLPLVEQCCWMDVRTQPVSIRVEKAYASGGTPLDVDAVATVKVSTEPENVGNAIERFLRHGQEAVKEVAARTLEGHLRSMVAGLTPEQVNQDRLRFADKVAEVSRPDLVKLGLQLDTFKIQRISDAVDYLDSLGRARLAVVLRDAAIAEAEALGEANQQEARADERAEVIATEVRTLVEERTNGLRTVRAQLDQQARTAEEQVEAVAQEARARADKALQTLRSELERRRLEADQVLPARAREEAEELRCRGAAAATAEKARASAAVNDQLVALWHQAGDQAPAIFVLQQIETVLAEAVAVAGQLQLGRISVLETGNPADLADLAALHPTVVRAFLEQVRDTLGIDVLQALNPHRPCQP